MAKGFELSDGRAQVDYRGGFCRGWVSITMEASFCVETLEEALAKHVFVKRLWCSVKYEEEAACLR